MSRPAPEIDLSTEEKETLLHWMRSTKTERRLVERARVILLAANGLNGKGSIEPARERRWCSVWMRSPAFKRWSGRRAGFACPTVEPSLALHTNTSAMAPPRSLRPWRWPLGWCMQGIIGAGADANFWIS